MSGAVADFPPSASLQQLTLPERIAAILDAAPTGPSTICAESFTYRELARIAYALDEREPTRAQLSAVRRSVARLIREGRAQHDSAGRDHYNSERTHYRTSRRGYRYRSGNPGGIRIQRPPNPDEREALLVRMESLLDRTEAREQATAYPIDTGSRVEAVHVEPVFVIREDGVEVRKPKDESAASAAVPPQDAWSRPKDGAAGLRRRVADLREELGGRG